MWTAYNPALERMVLKRMRYLADAAPVPAVEKPVAAASTKPSLAGSTLLAEKLLGALKS